MDGESVLSELKEKVISLKKYRFLAPAILEVEAAANFYEVNRSS